MSTEKTGNRSRPGAVRLEERYGRIGIAALAAAVHVGRKTDVPRQMTAEPAEPNKAGGQG